MPNITESLSRYHLTARENIVINLLTVHNVHFMNRLMQDIREALRNNTVRELEFVYL